MRTGTGNVSVENQDNALPCLKAPVRDLSIRSVYKGGAYDVLSRHLYDKSRDAHAPSPEEDYEEVSFSHLFSQNPDNGLLILDPSYFCNLKCTFCALPIESKTHVDWERLTPMLRMLIMAGMGRAVLTGGEPTILRTLIPILKDLRKWGCREIALFTHGMWAKNIPFLNSVLSAGITNVTMSLKAFNDSSALTLTGKNMFFPCRWKRFKIWVRRFSMVAYDASISIT